MENADARQEFLCLFELVPILAGQLAQSAGPGNRLVREYDMLDQSMILEAVGMAKNLYAQYVQEIKRYISDKAY